MGLLNQRVLPGNIALVIVAMLDLITTIYWLATGQMVEANPLMNALLQISPLLFVAVKAVSVTVFVLTLEWYRGQKPIVARQLCNFTLAAYLLIYFVSFCLVNAPLLLESL